MPKQNKLRFGIDLLSAMVLFGVSGCMASESQQGETFVYKNTILKTLLLLGIAVAMLGFGIAFVREAFKVKKPRKSKRSSRSGKRQKAEAPSPKNKTGTIVFGAGLTLGGVLILVLGVPSSLVQHITVAQDKVSMRLSVLWFSRGTREIPFSSITGITKTEQEVATRRGTRKEEIMYIHLASATNSNAKRVFELDSGPLRFEMGPLEKAAYPKLVEMWEAHQKIGQSDVADQQVAKQTVDPALPIPKSLLPKNPQAADQNVVQNPPNANSANPGFAPQKPTPIGQAPTTIPKNAIPIDESQLTPVTHIGRLFKGGEAMMKGMGDYASRQLHIVEVYAEGKLKVLPLGGKPGEERLVNFADVQPSNRSFYIAKEFGPGTLVDPANPPTVGTTLLAFHAGRWFEVEFIEMRGTDPVIQWPNEPNQLIAGSNMVRVPPPEGTKPYDGKRYNPPTDEGLTLWPERGPYAPGKAVYFREGTTSRKVIVVKVYAQQVAKVRDTETGKEFYAFRPELRTNP